jgi:uncharacterized membrane protein YvbJ
LAFCTNCGAQLAEGTKFCYDCGAAVTTGSRTTIPLITETQPKKSRQLLKRLGLGILIVFVVLFIAVLAGVLYIIYWLIR